MREVEGLGKNIEQAIENALFELKAPREDVDIKILCEGGLFKKAKVLVKISDDAIEKYEKKEEKRKEIIAEEKIQKEEKKVEKAEVKEEKKEIKQEKKEEKKEVKENKKQKADKTITPKEFLTNLFEKAGKQVEISEIEEERNIVYSVLGENISEFIGHRGETLFALSFLTSVLAGRTEKRVIVDIANYREKREESLKALAERVANKVVKTGRYAKLEPMDPSERRIIHMALQDNTKVSTMSKGTEPHRYIMIFPVEYRDKD